MRPAAVPVLYCAAIALAVTGAAARLGARQLWAPDIAPLPEHGSGARASVAPAAGPPPAAPAGLADAVISTNLFSPRRSTPTARYALDSNAASEVRFPTSPPPPPRRTIQLFGIGIIEGLATALLDADPLVPGAEIYHAGDALPRGGRVVAIASDHVVIETPEGRERLRMVPEPRRAPFIPTPPERK